MTSKLNHSLNCPNCKRPLEGDATKCPHCGKNFTQVDDGTPLLTGSVTGDRVAGGGIALATGCLSALLFPFLHQFLSVLDKMPDLLASGILLLLLPVTLSIFLKIRYPVVGKHFALACLFLYIVIPTIVIFGAFVVCAVMFSDGGKR